MTVGAETASAQSPADPLWQASYWNNQSLAGPPVLQRPENVIDHNWGNESPHPDVNADDFSARWVGNIRFEPGIYRFNAASDDGIRVWVDGDLIIDQWYDHPLRTFTANKRLSAGNHRIVVEYYENEKGAIARLWWAPAPPRDDQNWTGQYYDNLSFIGEPVVTRQDPQINFNWGTLPPAQGVAPNTFSVRWVRNLDLEPGTYRFTMTVDDGGRLWVNGRLVINAWQRQSVRTLSGDAYVPGGPTPVKMEYFDRQKAAVAQLTWEKAPVQTRSRLAEYFDNTNLEGSPAFVRNDETINFNWGADNSPSPAQLGLDRFSVRWTRTLDVPPGLYRFRMLVDDGGRLWVGDKLVIDAWQVQAAQVYTGQVILSGQPITARMEYFENSGRAVAQLSWEQRETLPASAFEQEVTTAEDLPQPLESYVNYFDTVGPEFSIAEDWENLLEENYDIITEDSRQ